jgi:membrane fusion protein, multidrug efflux system
VRHSGVVVLVAAALLGCGRGEDAPAQGGPGGPGGPGGGRGPGGPGGVVPVEVARVERGEIARGVTVSGVVEPIRVVAVNSQLSGALMAVHVEEGTAVREGAVLARLDDREIAAQLASAEANHQIAEAAYQRARQLRDRNVITLPEFERDRAAFAAAAAQLDQLRTRLGFATVRAPIAGVVTEKRVEAGDVVAPQTRLFTVADVSTMVVRVGLSEMDVVQVQVGDEVVVGLDAFPGMELTGRIRRIFPSATAGSRLVPVEVALAGEGARVVRPGFLARTTFALGAREALLIPASAVVRGAGGEAVFVVRNSEAARRTVRTGLTSMGRVEVVDGVSEGETVVMAGHNMLRDGMQVRIVAGDAGPDALAAPAVPAERGAPATAAPAGDGAAGARSRQGGRS